MTEAMLCWAGYQQAALIAAEHPDPLQRAKWQVMAENWLNSWFDACDRVLADSDKIILRVKGVK